MTKEVFFNEINIIDKLLPVVYDDKFNYKYTCKVDTYPIDVTKFQFINKSLKSFSSFYCSGDRFLVVKDHWLRCQAYNYQVQTYHGRINTYYIERNFTGQKLSKFCMEFLWNNLDRFLVLLSKHGKVYAGRAYLINQMLRKLYEREKYVR